MCQSKNEMERPDATEQSVCACGVDLSEYFGAIFGNDAPSGTAEIESAAATVPSSSPPPPPPSDDPFAIFDAPQTKTQPAQRRRSSVKVVDDLLSVFD